MNINGAQREALERKRTKKIHATPRQKLAARLRAENPTASDKEVLRRAGYDESTASVPTLVTGSLGYRAELARYGLTEELITIALVEDIQAKPQKRVRELELGADILKMRRREDEKPQLNVAIFSTEQQERIANRILSRLNGPTEPNSGDASHNRDCATDDTSPEAQ